MSETLTKMISNMTDEKEPSSLAAFVKALGVIMSKEDIDQKTQLSDRNIQGIMQGLTFNDSLERHFGFRIKEVDVLISEKLVKSISLDRLGKNELIELFRAMKLELEGSNVESVGNRIVLQRR
jgi:hypothetical protein